MDAGYKAMAADKERESEAKEWSDSLMADLADVPALCWERIGNLGFVDGHDALALKFRE